MVLCIILGLYYTAYLNSMSMVSIGTSSISMVSVGTSSISMVSVGTSS